MTEKIICIVETEVGKNVTPQTTIEQLDIESLEFLEMILAIQEATGIIIPDAEISKINTICDLISTFERYSAKA